MKIFRAARPRTADPRKKSTRVFQDIFKTNSSFASIDISKHPFMDFSTSRDFLIAYLLFQSWISQQKFSPALPFGCFDHKRKVLYKIKNKNFGNPARSGTFCNAKLIRKSLIITFRDPFKQEVQKRIMIRRHFAKINNIYMLTTRVW